MSACAGVEGSEKKQVKDPVREKGGYCILYLCFTAILKYLLVNCQKKQKRINPTSIHLNTFEK